MKKYEIEAFIKSFLLFFFLQLSLMSLIMIQNYHAGLRQIDDAVKSEMKLCSFDLKCEGLELDFVEKSPQFVVRKLYKEGDLYSFFDVPTADGYLLKVILKKESYQARIENLKKGLWVDALLYLFGIILLSLLFSLYALYPLKKALKLNDEFIKDILHDINTPLSSMVINFKLFKKEVGENRKIVRMEHSVATIVSLQENLKAFLDTSLLQKEKFSLQGLLQDRVTYFQALYPDIHFSIKESTITLSCNQEALRRIVDNLLSNSCKYSPKDATISLYMKKSRLYIKDNGAGIKDTKKIFDRYYKENDRGIGIGMHIVKKLCDALHLPIMIESQLGEGTTIMIELDEVIVR